METNEVSIHQVKIYDFVRVHGGWVTTKDIASGCAVARRTAHAHAHKFVHLGIFDQAEVFPEHRYRLSSQAQNRNKAIILRLDAAREIFGLTA